MAEIDPKTNGTVTGLATVGLEEGKTHKQEGLPHTESETDHHLTGSALFLVLGGLSLAIYLFALDISVISTVLLACFCCIFLETDPDRRLSLK